MPGVIGPSGGLGKIGGNIRAPQVSRGWTYFGDPELTELSDIVSAAKAAAAQADVLGTWDDYRSVLGDVLPARLDHTTAMRARILAAVR